MRSGSGSGLGSSYGLIPLLPADRDRELQRNSVSFGVKEEGAGGEGRKMGMSDPRDHSVLEHIYAEMHAERFINLAPLSLLANSLPLYFKGTLFLILLSLTPYLMLMRVQ